MKRVRQNIFNFFPQKKKYGERVEVWDWQGAWRVVSVNTDHASYLAVEVRTQ